MVTPVTQEYELKHESLRLLQQYQEEASAKIRNQLVHLNFGLVRKEAHHWANQCTESYEDLLQVGCIGLIRAIERFDTTSCFSHYADCGDPEKTIYNVSASGMDADHRLDRCTDHELDGIYIAGGKYWQTIVKQKSPTIG